MLLVVASPFQYENKHSSETLRPKTKANERKKGGKDSSDLLEPNANSHIP